MFAWKALHFGARTARFAGAFSVGLVGGSAILAHTEKSTEKKSSPPKSAAELFYDTLPRQRAIYLSGAIDDISAKMVIGQLLALEFDQPGEPITLFITSRGGSVYAGLGVIDVMNICSSPVRTVCVGHCESMGALILAAGEPGSRYALPHARIMLHQPFARLGDVKRTADDVQLHAIELSKTRATLLDMVCRATGKTAEVINSVFCKDSYFTAEEARELGVIDAIAGSLAMIESNVAAKPSGAATPAEAPLAPAAAVDAAPVG